MSAFEKIKYNMKNKIASEKPKKKEDKEIDEY